MAVQLNGLTTDDLAEIVECLIIGADSSADRAPALTARRRELAHRIGDGLDLLPVPVAIEQPTTT